MRSGVFRKNTRKRRLSGRFRPSGGASVAFFRHANTRMSPFSGVSLKHSTPCFIKTTYRLRPVEPVRGLWPSPPPLIPRSRSDDPLRGSPVREFSTVLEDRARHPVAQLDSHVGELHDAHSLPSDVPHAGARRRTVRREHLVGRDLLRLLPHLGHHGSDLGRDGGQEVAQTDGRASRGVARNQLRARRDRSRPVAAPCDALLPGLCGGPLARVPGDHGEQRAARQGRALHGYHAGRDDGRRRPGAARGRCPCRSLRHAHDVLLGRCRALCDHAPSDLLHQRAEA